MSQYKTRLASVRSVLIGTILIPFATASYGNETAAAAPAKDAPAAATAAKESTGNQAPVKAEQPTLVQNVDLVFYYSPNAGFKHNGTKMGDASIQRYQFNYTVGYGAAEGLWLQGGIHANYMSMNSDSAVLLPSHLQAIGLFGSATKDLSDLLGRGWGTTLILRPMLTSSSSNFSAAGAVLQGGWVASYRQSETVRWSAGIAFSTHTSGNGILPIVGLLWDINEDWLLSIGFPETSISYKLTEDTTLKGIVGFMQGSYRVKNAPVPGGGDTYLDFREIRIGAGVTHQFTDILSLELDAGAVVDRRFDYYNRNYKLKGDVAAYLMLSLNLEF